jgi:hypothetical protein
LDKVQTMVTDEFLIHLEEEYPPHLDLIHLNLIHLNLLRVEEEED